MNMGPFSKAIGAIVGNLVALVLAYLASRGLAECKVIVDVEECSIFGVTQGQFTAAVMFVFNTVFVYMFPANKPST